MSIENEKIKTTTKMKKYISNVFSGSHWKNKLLIFAIILFFVFSTHFGLYIANKMGKFNYTSSNWIGINTVYNNGIAFGFLANSPVITFTIKMMFVLCLLVCFIISTQKMIYSPLTLMIAGGGANLLNKIINPNEGVLDYIRIKLNLKWLNFTCNIPDVFIFIGTIWLLISMIFLFFSSLSHTNFKKSKKNESSNK